MQSSTSFIIENRHYYKKKGVSAIFRVTTRSKHDNFCGRKNYKGPIYAAIAKFHY